MSATPDIRTPAVPDMANVDEQGRPVCAYCDKLLRKAASSFFWRFDVNQIQPYGWLGSCIFCSERCAARWAVVKASSMTTGEGS